MSEEQATITTLDVATQQLTETPVPSHQPASETAPEADAPPAQKPPAESGPQGDEPTSVEDGGEPEQPRQGKNRYARKIDDLTRQAAEERREKQELLQTLRQLTQTREQAPQPQQPQVPAEYANDPGYDPQDPEPSRDDFDDYDRYSRALTRWEARMEVRGESKRQAVRQHQQRMVQEVMQETASIAQHYNQTAQAWDQQHPEFSEKVESLRGISAEANPVMTRAIFTSHNPPAILDALATVPQVAHRITQMKPAEQIRAIAFIESRLASQPAQVSNAPAVGRPVGTTTATSRSAYRDDFTPEQHRAWKKANGIG